MEHPGNPLSIRERMKRAIELRNEYGPDIPKNLLDEVDYVSFEDDSGQLILMTTELFAKRALEKTITPETSKLPFETVSFTVDTSSEIGAKIPLDALHRKIEDTYLKLGYRNYGNNDECYYPYQNGIAERYPHLVQFAARFDLERSRLAAQYLDLPPPSLQHVIDDKEEIGVDILSSVAENICNETKTDITDYADIRSIWWKANSNRVPTEAAQRILSISQQTRAKLADISEITPHVQSAFQQVAGFPGLEIPDEAEREPQLPAHITGWDVSKKALSNLLSEDGLLTAAEAIRQTEIYDDILTIVDSPAVASERIAQLKREQKELQSTIADPHERFSKQSQIKNQIKATHRTITTLRQLLHFDQTYAEYAAAVLNDLDEVLLHKSSKNRTTVELDARPDKEKDANPGKMSGDCTEGKPLPFGIEPGLLNVKVAIDGQYVGNIYSYQTTSEDSYSVWHFDAIQIPNRAIDWQTFPAKLIQTLGPIAREKNIDMITINSRQYLISNYDYVAKGFMQYLQANTPAVEYDNMDQPSTAGEIEGEHIKTVSINFPEKRSDDDYSQLQGADSDQIILWENPNRSSVE